MNKSDICSTNQWTRMPDRKEGATRTNLNYLRKFREASSELAKYGIMLHFLVTELNVTYARRMMISVKKQRYFIWVVTKNLEKYRIEKKYEKLFDDDLKSFEKRIEQIKRITKEVVHLTEYEPFFNTVGWDELIIDRSPTWEEIEASEASVLHDLGVRAKEWNAEHADEVTAHMDAVRPEIERHEKHVRKVIEDAKAEKMAEKMAKKAERDELREIERNRKEYRRVEKSFERFYH